MHVTTDTMPTVLSHHRITLGLRIISISVGVFRIMSLIDGYYLERHNGLFHLLTNDLIECKRRIILGQAPYFHPILRLCVDRPDHDSAGFTHFLMQFVIDFYDAHHLPHLNFIYILYMNHISTS